MISVEEARRRILEPLAPLPGETIALSQARGRVLARDICARLTQPPANVSAMDGYAVRAADAGAAAVLRVIAESAAGHPFVGALNASEAVRLFTGSVLPSGADSVLPQEDVERAGNEVRVREAARPGRHVRPCGQDFAAGQIVLRAGMRLGPRDLGLAAAADTPWVLVRRQPRIAILATGDEIALPGEPRPDGGIVSSNSLMLASLIEEEGATATLLPIAADTPEDVARRAAQAEGADLLLTSGGASVGDHDAVRAGLERCGFVLDFWQIAMRPGKPMLFGRLGSMPVLGLPGNPVSAFVCSFLFLMPALRRLQGLSDLAPPVASAFTAGPLGGNDHREDYLRARWERDDAGRLMVTPFARQDSGMLTSLAEADCLIVRSPHAPPAEAGEPVRVVPLRPLFSGRAAL